MKCMYKLMIYLDKCEYIWNNNDSKYFHPKKEYKFSSIIGLSLIYPVTQLTKAFWGFCHWLDNAIKISADNKSVSQEQTKKEKL